MVAAGFLRHTISESAKTDSNKSAVQNKTGHDG